MNLGKKYFAIAAFSVLMLPAPVALAVPAGMSQTCQDQYAKYSASSGTKAFAKGKTKACGWQFSKGDLSLTEVKKRAVAFCVGHGGDGCKVVESAK